jgi:flagellar basal-body rod protein FlgB
VISDLTLQALRAGLDGLTVQRRLGEDAVANVETPGYIAGSVDFEDSLADAIESGDPSSFRPTFSSKTDAVLPNGNNVQLDRELTGLTANALQQQLLVEAVNAKFRLLRTVIVGQ